jgi:hypothetical protein
MALTIIEFHIPIIEIGKVGGILMDRNMLLRAGMRTCGRVLNLLPKDGDTGIGSPTKYMVRILTEETLPSLDILHPIIITKTFTTGSLIPVDINSEEIVDLSINDLQANRVINDDRYSTFRVPASITNGYKIMTVKSCVPVRANGAGVGAYGSYYNEAPWNTHFGRASSGDLYGTVMAANVDYVDRLLVGEVSRQFRFYFYEPNILMITNYMGALSAKFCCRNDESLTTLDDMTYEATRRLFILDLKKSIFNEYGNYTELDTAFGSLDLKIGDWSSAENERNELFDTYRSTSHFRTSSLRS